MSGHRKVTRALVLGLVLAAPSAAVLAGDLRARFDRRQVHEGDTVILTIEKDGTGSAGSPDLSALKQDFDVLGTSSGTQIRIVNGARSDTTSWQVTLSPKRTGVLAVPPIAIGSDSTPSLTLTVSPLSQGALGSPGDDVFVELEVGEGGQAQTDGVLVQQQVPVTVRLYSARPLLSGDLSEPRVEDAVLAKLGEDRQYRTQRQGREYQVVERRYSLSPEKSGELRIPPVVFKGTVRAAPSQAQSQRRGGQGWAFDAPGFDRFFQDPDLDRFFGNALGGRDPFGMFERGEAVRAQSKGVDLKVRARPQGVAAAHWLPAQGLDITDSWTEDPPQLRVGEPVTRTLTLSAKGLSGAQVPEVRLPEVDGLRVYPEKTEAETRTDGETVFGVSKQTFTLIPSRAGSFAIPEVRVAWWDTAAQQERVTTLPAWNLQAEGDQSEAAPKGTAGPAQAGPSPAPAADAPEAQVQGSAGAGVADRRPPYLRPRFLAGLALVLFGILGALVLRRAAGARRWGRQCSGVLRAQDRRPERAIRLASPTGGALGAQTDLARGLRGQRPAGGRQGLAALGRGGLARGPAPKPGGLGDTHHPCGGGAAQGVGAAALRPQRRDLGGRPPVGGTEGWVGASRSRGPGRGPGRRWPRPPLPGAGLMWVPAGCDLARVRRKGGCERSTAFPAASGGPCAPASLAGGRPCRLPACAGPGERGRR